MAATRWAWLACPAVEIGEVLGWVGGLLVVVRLLPQPWHTWRTGAVHGVSGTALANNLVSDVGWTAYGLAAGLTPLWVAGAATVVVDVLTIALARSAVGRRAVASGLAWAAVLALAWVGGGAVVFGTVLGVATVVNHAPQVATALRSSDLSGLHPATWWLSLADAGLWGGYGLLVGDLGVVAYGVVLGMAGSIVLGRIAWTRRVAVVADAPA